MPFRTPPTHQAVALLVLVVLPLIGAIPSGAGEWVRIASSGDGIAIEYSTSSVRSVTPTIKRARTRFVSPDNQMLPRVNVHSVESEIEYHCIQPLEKLLSAEVFPTANATPLKEQVEFPVFSEINHGSGSFLLWRAICFDATAK